MSTRTVLLTVAEYEKISDPPGGRYELHHGELVFVPFPVFEHGRTERQLVFMLEHNCGCDYFVCNELACRPFPEHELWSVDVGMVAWERAEATTQWVMGAPELVVEVLSPSNTKAEMDDRKRTMFAGGCVQFWIVELKSKTVTVSTPDGQERVYKAGDQVPLDVFGGPSIAVDDIFAVRKGRFSPRQTS